MPDSHCPSQDPIRIASHAQNIGHWRSKSMDDAGRLGRSGGNRGARALDDARLGGPTDEAEVLLRTGDREANNRIDRTAAADALKLLIINDLAGATGLEPNPRGFSNLPMVRDSRHKSLRMRCLVPVFFDSPGVPCSPLESSAVMEMCWRRSGSNDRRLESSAVAGTLWRPTDIRPRPPHGHAASLLRSIPAELYPFVPSSRSRFFAVTR